MIINATVELTVNVEFEDDGETDLTEQALLQAAIDLSDLNDNEPVITIHGDINE